jgi:hypothetical protein
MPSPPSNYIYDGFLSFEAGVNGGVAPLLLPKNQLATLINGTLRGTFITPRSPYQEIALATPLPPLLFQGASYYKPDTGPESVCVALGGRLFQIIPSATTATVIEQTIPQDPNPPQNTIAWLWQSERWLIWNDGVSVPIFFDGNTPTITRRSLQYAPQLYTTLSAFVAPSAVGGTVEIQLSAPYTQGPDFPVVISANPEASLSADPKMDLYTLSPATGATLTLTNVGDHRVGKTVLGAQNVVVNSAFLGYVVDATSVVGPVYVRGKNLVQDWTANITLSATYPAVSGQTLAYYSYTVTQFVGAPFPTLPVPGSPFYAGQTNDSIIATTIAGNIGQFVVPTPGQSVTINIQAPYNGPLPQNVFINGYLYQVTAVNNNISNLVIATLLSGTVNPSPPPAELPNTTSPYVAGAIVQSSAAGAELPPGRMGAYGLGNNWVSLPGGYTFMAGDLVGSSSGTKLYNFRDAVLKVTQNALIVGGGNFSVPNTGGQIQALVFVANLDVSLGQGPLEVFTDTSVYSCTVPILSTNWLSTTSPILTQSLIASGATAQDSTVISNSDVIFRSPIGISSLILSRRDFNTWGNVPISQEVQQYLATDSQALLPYSRAADFDNRHLQTQNPVQGPLGVYHTGLVVTNYDPISSLRGKSPSIYDGLWQDLNVLKIITGKFSGVIRCFVFHYNITANTIEFWEILPTAATNAIPITTTIEFPVFDFGEKDPRSREWKFLEDGEIFMDQIDGQVQVQSFYRPDYSSEYQPWSQFTVPGLPSYQPRLGLDKPLRAFDATADQGGTGRRFSAGFTFQMKLVITGLGWRLMGGRIMGSRQPQPQFPPALPYTPPS